MLTSCRDSPCGTIGVGDLLPLTVEGRRGYSTVEGIQASSRDYSMHFDDRPSGRSSDRQDDQIIAPALPVHPPRRGSLERQKPQDQHLWCSSRGLCRRRVTGDHDPNIQLSGFLNAIICSFLWDIEFFAEVFIRSNYLVCLFVCNDFEFIPQIIYLIRMIFINHVVICLLYI